MAMRFNNQTEAKAWLQQTKGNKLERSKLDDNQKWSFMQAKYAVTLITGEYENEEYDTGIDVEILHGNRQDLILDIYNEMQTTIFGCGFEGHGYDCESVQMKYLEKQNYKENQNNQKRLTNFT